MSDPLRRRASAKAMRDWRPGMPWPCDCEQCRERTARYKAYFDHMQAQMKADTERTLARFSGLGREDADD